MRSDKNFKTTIVILIRCLSVFVLLATMLRFFSVINEMSEHNELAKQANE